MKKINNVVRIITKATGPLVNIALAKNNHGIMQRRLSSLEIFFQKDRRLAPKVAHKSVT